LNNSYLKKTHGGNVPMVHAMGMNDEPDVISVIEDKLQKSIETLTKKISEQRGLSNNNENNRNNNNNRNNWNNQNQRRFNNNHNNNNNNSNNNNNITCYRCEKQGHMIRDCQSRIQCNKCNRFGHLAKNCGVQCNNCKRFGHKTEDCRTIRNDTNQRNVNDNWRRNNQQNQNNQ